MGSVEMFRGRDQEKLSDDNGKVACSGTEIEADFYLCGTTGFLADTSRPGLCGRSTRLHVPGGVRLGDLHRAGRNERKDKEPASSSRHSVPPTSRILHSQWSRSAAEQPFGSLLELAKLVTHQ
jgi:hypothetical protein